MNHLEINIVALIPTRAGCAVFLGKGKKVIHFFIDLHIGQAINMELAGDQSERPLTHDLFSRTMRGFGARMTHMIISDYRDEIYYAKIFWEMENEVKQKSIVEVDSRPSDALALAVRQKAKILMAESVWEASEDRSELLADLKAQVGDIDGLM